MELSPARRCALNVTVAELLIVAGTFMSWGVVRNVPMTAHFPGVDEAIPFGNMTLTLNGFQGTVGLLGVDLPNWMVLVASVGVMLVCWIASFSSTPSVPKLAYVFAGYGATHLAVLLVMLASRGSIGVGLVLTVAAFVAVLVNLLWLAQRIRPMMQPNVDGPAPTFPA